MRWRLFVITFLVLLFMTYPLIGSVLSNVKVTGVSLDQNNLVVEKNGEAILTATVKPKDATNKEVLWESSDPLVVDVLPSPDLSAKIRAKSAGTAVITVITKDGKRQDQCNVEVIVLMRSLSLDFNKATLNPSEELILNVQIMPPDTTNQELIWQSTNPGFASVVPVDLRTTVATNQQGKVTAHREGETTIIVRSVENNSITAQYSVTVSASAQEADNTGQPQPTAKQTENIDHASPIDSDQSLGLTKTGHSVYWLIGLSVLLLLAVLIFIIFYLNRQKAILPVKAIKAVSGHFAGQTFSLFKDQLAIGRDAEQVQVAYPQSNQQISRKHCVLKYDRPNNKYILLDASTNGTFLSNGERLTPGKQYILMPGERFYLADPAELFEVLS